MKINFIYTFVLVLLISFGASAQEVVFPYEKGDASILPVSKKDYRPQFSFAPQVAYVNFHAAGISGVAYGGEIAMQCPLLCTSKNYIRQQVSVLYYSDEDLNILEATLNPEYRFFVKPMFELAAGPSFGYLHAKYSVDESSRGLFSYGLSASATQHIGSRVIIGLGVRENWAGNNLSHFQAMLKVGVKI